MRVANTATYSFLKLYPTPPTLYCKSALDGLRGWVGKTLVIT